MYLVKVLVCFCSFFVEELSLDVHFLSFLTYCSSVSTVLLITAGIDNKQLLNHGLWSALNIPYSALYIYNLAIVVLAHNAIYILISISIFIYF